MHRKQTVLATWCVRGETFFKKESPLIFALHSANALIRYNRRARPQLRSAQSDLPLSSNHSLSSNHGVKIPKD